MSLLRLLAVIAGLAWAGPAFAHAVLQSSDPGEGATLAQTPRTIQLRFNEPVQALVMRVIDPRGAAHELAPRSVGELVEATLADDLPDGTQILSYRVASQDGHPVGASLSFSIGTAGPAPEIPLESSTRAILIWAVKALDLTLLLGGAGMAFFFAFLSPVAPTSRFRRISLGAQGAGGLLVCLSIGLQGLDLLGLPLKSLTDMTPWRAVAGSSFATMALFELLGFSLMALSLTMHRENLPRILAIMALLCAGFARAASGHAALADPEWLMRPAVFAHTVAAAIWAGALPPLLWLALCNASAFQGALRRFSTLALVSVEVLLIVGVLIAAVQAPEPSSLLSSAYGRLLALKLMLVATLLLLALWNRRVGTPRVLAQDKRATRLIAGSMAVEIGLLLGVFAVVAAWRFTPPPRALMEARATTGQEIGSGHFRAVVQLEPGLVGENRISVTLLDHASMAPPAREVTITLAAPWLGIEPRVLTTRGPDAGLWRTEQVYLPAAGAWTITVEAMVSDFEKQTAEGTYRISP